MEYYLNHLPRQYNTVIKLDRHTPKINIKFHYEYEGKMEMTDV